MHQLILMAFILGFLIMFMFCYDQWVLGKRHAVKHSKVNRHHLWIIDILMGIGMTIATAGLLGWLLIMGLML
jgi:hypothetical protein